MPTARPIMVTISVTKKLSSKTWPMSATRPNAMAMDTTARPIGARAATTAPKSTSRMMSATGMPNRSPCSSSSLANSRDS